jgi:hypothetical protein
MKDLPIATHCWTIFFIAGITNSKLKIKRFEHTQLSHTTILITLGMKTFDESSSYHGVITFSLLAS